MATTRFRLVFRAPLCSVDACKQAIFQAGAGKYKEYSECCFTVVGTGQFRPGDAANPHIGRVGNLENVEEARVETVCIGEEIIKAAVEALKIAHPYEEPSYEVYKLEDY
ncbi:uncharacterized protein PpBr36_11001 [Pyricularia pennisetigena]|uniref:uncharacterized protein n=1 Tax=Pyricularia pennisetigena TaxID=1578925 RepID=UPI00114F5246|nr:uncharacterized protein PpBr36_11001 [Pyricularia pennisetigena]TLS20713.1 hypothetical protein PpBr36_11001 [Pyricularia pennisetigena]